MDINTSNAVRAVPLCYLVVLNLLLFGCFIKAVQMILLVIDSFHCFNIFKTCQLLIKNSRWQKFGTLSCEIKLHWDMKENGIFLVKRIKSCSTVTNPSHCYKFHDIHIVFIVNFNYIFAYEFNRKKFKRVWRIITLLQ